MDNEVRYVGISTKPKRRLREHLTKKATNHKVNWLNKLKSNGLSPQLKVVKSNLSEDEAKILEIAFGALFFFLNKKPLVNNISALGGIPPNRKGKPRTEETKRKISQAKKVFYQIPANIEAISGENNSFYGKTHSKETRSKISKALRGRAVGKNNPFYGQAHSKETKKLLAQK